MAVIKREIAASMDAQALNLVDVRRQADEMLEAARAKADRIVAEANAERERIVDGASEHGYAEGFAKGEAEGVESGKEAGEQNANGSHGERLEILAGAIAGALQRLDRERESIIDQTRSDIVELAALIASRVAKRVIDLDPDAGEAQLRHVLSLVTGPTSVRIAVSAEDEPLIAEVLPGLISTLSSVTHADLEVDDSLPRGSCVVKTAGGVVFDANVQTQIDRLAALICPAKSGSGTGQVASTPSLESSSDDHQERAA